MGTIQFSYINRADEATLSGGSYQPTLPIANLQETNMAMVARTLDVTAASTRIDVDFGASGKLIRLVGLMRHNCTVNATYRITGSNSSVSGSEGYDSGTLNVWPRIYSLTDLDFEEPNWWTGQIDAAEAALYPIKLLHDLGANYLLRYWRVQINDTANPAGYLQFSRFWMGPVWAPEVGYGYGGRMLWEPRDRSSVSRNGKRYAERINPIRVFSLRLESVSDADAYGRVLDMQRRLGSEGQVVVIPDPDDTGQRHRRDIIARIRRSGGAAHSSFGRQQAEMELEELP